MSMPEQVRQYLYDIEKWLEEIKEWLLERQQIEDNSLFVDLDNIKEDIKKQLEMDVLNEDCLMQTNEILKEVTERIQMCAQEENRERDSVPIGKHRLPPLPYAYDALEPYINKEIMRLHHTKHHQSYVDGLNKAEQMMKEAREANQYELIKHWEREAAFHGSGHYLHSIFWEIMNPRGGGKPTGALLQQIQQDFGTYEQFKKHFSEAAKKVEGVGWTLLVWSPRSRRLEILQSERHQLMTQWDTIPLLVLDVWEHAYYLQYKNDRGQYVDNWWNIVYWPAVSQRFNEAKKLKWRPY
ncbi:superoxide dismutase [Bacillus songklensis]|uniref:superoxide dismutase n=1 Tax=Bacillus songklensis TaxID=1069116 RepID=A0ABV8AZR4_9BACI